RQPGRLRGRGAGRGRGRRAGAGRGEPPHAPHPRRLQRAGLAHRSADPGGDVAAAVSTEAPGDVERAIGRHGATLIPDGATIQVGIGCIPDAVLAALAGHRDLGVHTEMLSDGVMRLAEAGVINGCRKTLLPGKMVTSFVMGSEALYRWVDDH